MPITNNASLNTDHNVYILGAGFSVGRGLPVIGNFLDRMRDTRESVGSQAEADAIDAVLAFRATAAAASDRISFNTESIEELFSLADLSGDQRMSAAIPLAIAATLDHAQATSSAEKVRFETLAHFPHPPSWNASAQITGDGHRNNYYESMYEVLLASICGNLGMRGGNRRDTFITFNYDTVLEEAATKLNMAIDYGLDWPPTAGAARRHDLPVVRILKLHGSVNWGRTTGGNETLQVAPTYAALRTLGGQPLIIPPTWRKNFPEDLATVWAQAIDSLSSATRVAVVGYSMPQSDSHFKYLLTAGLKDNISLRRLAFVDYAPVHGTSSSPYTSTGVEARARSLIRSEWWDRNRASFTDAGARTFFLSTLTRPEWNRPAIEGVSVQV